MVGFPPPAPTFPAVSAGKEMSAFPSPARMRTASSAATADRGSGMERPAASRAAVGGKLRVNKAIEPAKPASAVRRLLLAPAALLAVLAFGSAGHAQSGPFAGMAG